MTVAREWGHCIARFQVARRSTSLGENTINTWSDTKTQLRQRNNNQEAERQDSQFTCSTCNKSYSTIDEIDKHLDEHEMLIAKTTPEPEKNTQEDADALKLMKTELTIITKNTDITDYILKLMVPCVAEHSNGESSTVLLTLAGAKRHLEDPITSLRLIKRRPESAFDMDYAELGAALTSHRFGELVDIEQYQPIKQTLFLSDFQTHWEDIAKTLAGSLLQSGSKVILIIKAEVYGRIPEDDVHGLDMVKPIWEPKVVTVFRRGNSRRLLIGTLRWSALVTASIDLTSGDISIGTTNISTPFTDEIRIWTRKDYALNPLTERQVLSKFHHDITLAKRAAIYFLFADWICYPVTIYRLLEYYYDKEMTGTKAVAVLFNQLLKAKTLRKDLLKELLNDLEGHEDRSVARTLRALLRLFGSDEQERGLKDDEKMSMLLRALADGVRGTLEALDEEKVKAAIKARSELLLRCKNRD
ncbi:hypothetical protein BG011_004644 [Mortierella polycephala]|uniref:C2H2-type domain-containing protein n=1 Tax=Mortierella polycephala TaxID=41804 RepID=A0A9P6PZZ3_9FUNG|nr:hypothetical protein BG011_004644 [Mortierella polycephala]